MDPDHRSHAPDLVEQLLRASLSGTAAPWPPDADDRFGDEVLEAARDHGVEALLAGPVTHRSAPGWPERLREHLRAHVRAEAATEVLRRAEVERVLSLLERGGVPAVLMKGAPLAYSHYPKPWLRPRVDTDLLIDPARQAASVEVMTAEGYALGTGFSGELVTHQHEWEQIDRHGLRHVFDIHTRAANPHLFASLFEFPELASRAVPVPELGPAAPGATAVDALLLAGIHRVAHHYGTNRLIWLYDIHLLLGAMDDADLRALAKRATAKGIRAVTAAAVSASCERFAQPVPPLVAALAASPAEPAEATARFLEPGRTKVDILLADLRVLPGWRQRIQLVLEHLFPPAAYIRQAYAVSHPIMLALAYTHRILAGVARWFRRN